jgi:hypothetical protein
MNSNYRVAATLFQRNMVCFRYIGVNTLHKGDDGGDKSVCRWMVLCLVPAKEGQHVPERVAKV